MAVLRAKRNRRKRKVISRRKGAEEAHATSETNCKGPNATSVIASRTKFTATRPYRTRLVKSDRRELRSPCLIC
jgi:hypothetical protein